MGVQVMLTLDLESGVSEERRQKFNEYMAAQKRTKIPKVTTVWRASFQEGVTYDGAAQATKNDIARAASAAGITYYEAVMHLGPNPPISFKN